MSNLKLYKLTEKIRYINKKDYINFLPKQTVSVNINNAEYYISVICDDNFEVKVVLLDSDKKIVYEILKSNVEKIYITKIQNNLYVFEPNNAYIYNINNLKDNPIKLYLGNLNLQCVCSNDNNIFAYSIQEDKIIKYDKNLTRVNSYDNSLSKEDVRVSLQLACNQETFFSVPIMTPTEEQYILMKNFLAYYINPKIAKDNDQISSCSFNYDENTLYIAMYNMILVLKNGIEFSYLHFKRGGISSILYDNDMKKMIINLGQRKGNHISGSIVELSDEEIKKMSKHLSNVSSTFNYYGEFHEDKKNYIDNNFEQSYIEDSKHY